MITPSSFTLDSTISFNLYPAAILGARVAQVKVTDILSYDTAKLYVSDLAAMHAQVFPTLPKNLGTPNDPRQYKYVKVALPDGSVMAYGLPWIVDGSIEVYNGTSYAYTFDNLTPDDKARLDEVLSMAGYTSIDVRQLDGTDGSTSGLTPGVSGSASGN